MNVAEAYRAGAQLLANDLRGVGGWSGQPTRYLYYHAIEVYFKAALISAGLREGELKDVGHSFRRMAETANARGLGLTEPDDLRTLALIDSDGNYVRARYHHVGAFRVATIQALDMTSFELAVLTSEMIRRTGVSVRAPKPALPYEFRFQVL